MSVFEDAKQLRGWYDRVRSGRQNVDNIRQLIADHGIGSRNFTRRTRQAEIRTDTIFDSTTSQSNQLLGGYLAGTMTNPYIDYFELMPDDRALLDDDDARHWLDDTKQRLLRQQRDTRSGFLTQSAEIYLDLPGFGMGAMSCMPNRKLGMPSFTSHALSEIYVQLNESRQVDTIFRCLPLTARQWAQRFPKDKDASVVKALESGNTESEFEAVQVLAPSDDPYAGQSPFRKPITSVYFTVSGVPRILETNGFNSMPIKTPRWSVEPGEVYGSGPGRIALPNTMMLNQVMRTIITYAQKSSDPPLQAVNEAILDGIRTHPGGVTYIQQLFGMSGSSLAIQPLPLNPDHRLTVDLLNRIQLDVRNAFYAQLLQLFTDSNMSATQVIELSKQIQQLLAPILGRVQTEWVEPILDRQLEVSLQMGLLLPIPTSLRGQEIRPVFQSPVARVARAQEGRATMEMVQAAAAVAQSLGSPAPLDLIDADAVIRTLHTAQSAPFSILRTRDAIEQLREQRQQQQEQQQGLDQLGQGAEIAGTLAKAENELVAQAA